MELLQKRQTASVTLIIIATRDDTDVLDGVTFRHRFSYFALIAWSADRIKAEKLLEL